MRKKNPFSDCLYVTTHTTKNSKNTSNSSELLIAIIWANLAFSAHAISSEKVLFQIPGFTQVIMQMVILIQYLTSITSKDARKPLARQLCSKGPPSKKSYLHYPKWEYDLSEICQDYLLKYSIYPLLSIGGVIIQLIPIWFYATYIYAFVKTWLFIPSSTIYTKHMLFHKST